MKQNNRTEFSAFLMALVFTFNFSKLPYRKPIQQHAFDIRSSMLKPHNFLQDTTEDMAFQKIPTSVFGKQCKQVVDDNANRFPTKGPTLLLIVLRNTLVNPRRFGKHVVLYDTRVSGQLLNLSVNVRQNTLGSHRTFLAVHKTEI